MRGAERGRKLLRTRMEQSLIFPLSVSLRELGFGQTLPYLVEMNSCRAAAYSLLNSLLPGNFARRGFRGTFLNDRVGARSPSMAHPQVFEPVTSAFGGQFP